MRIKGLKRIGYTVNHVLTSLLPLKIPLLGEATDWLLSKTKRIIET